MTDAEAAPSDDQQTFTLWLVLIVVGIVFGVSLLAYFSHWHWLGSLWFGYAWPSDKGNGPEAIQQTLLYALIAVLVIPPVRKWFLTKFHHVHEKLDNVHEAIHVHHAQAMERQDLLLRQNAHMIRHNPDLDNDDHEGVSLVDIPPVSPPKELP